MSLSPRARSLIFAGIALLALIGLAITLNNLELENGRPLPLWNSDQGTLQTPESWQDVALAILRVAIVVVWVMLFIFVLLFIFSKKFRKQFLRDMAFIVPMLLAVYFFFRPRGNAALEQEALPGAGFELGELETDLEAAGELPVYTPPDPWVTDLFTILVAVVLVLAVAVTGWILYRRKQAKKLEPLRRIQDEAQAALDEIESGGDLRDAVIRAYLQMIQALKQFRNIHRDQHVTPHEFESYLAQRGLPREPVHQLTQLFEQVRYGGAAPGRAEEHAAVSSLSAIIAACQRERGSAHE